MPLMVRFVTTHQLRICAMRAESRRSRPRRGGLTSTAHPSRRVGPNKLRTQLRELDDSDPIPPPMGILAGRHHYPVDKAVTDLAFQPIETPHVLIVGSCGKLHLNGGNLSILSLDNEVDPALSIASAQMPDMSTSCTRVDPHALGDQRFEECAGPSTCRSQALVGVLRQSD